MKTAWLISGLGLFGFAGLLGLNSCVTSPRAVVVPAEIPGANYVGQRACMDCHTNYVRSFAASPHARIHLAAAAAPRGQSGCESCHGPGSRHIEAGGARQFILNPGRDPAACLKCHLATHAEFRLPYRHPVLEGRLNCVQCHDPHGADIFKPKGGLAMAQVNEACAGCHREQTRPFAFEHEAMREGCVVCHQPHGSVNRKLLTESDVNLCLKCHAQTPVAGSAGAIYIGKVDHTAFLRQGTCWSAGCHSAVHGSNVDPRMRF
jgi:predicted CXXCH cytochrome family protein